ncbi:MAG: hypothetical protein KF901_21425 [Myxococcales bacterium]|nr:hypothetical protein [Myxococcales bacterium]
MKTLLGLIGLLALVTCGSDPGFELPPVPDAAAPDGARPDGAPEDAAMDARADAPDAPGPDAPDATSADAGSPRPPYDWDDAILYFALTDRFANGDPSNDDFGDDCFDPGSLLRFHGGDLEGLRTRALPYLRELGANALWITPVQRQVGRRGMRCAYHGYWADLDDPDDGRIERRLGTAATLDRLLADMHANDLRLVVDFVVNHVGYNARLTRTRPEWFHDPATCRDLGPADLYCPLANLPDLAHDRADVRAYLDALSQRFVRRFDIDAIRMDTVKHVPVSYFRDHWIPTVRAERDLWLIGELLDGGSYDPFVPYLDAGFDGLFDFPLRQAFVDTFAHGRSLNAVATRVDEYIRRFGLAAARRKSNLLDNHDLNRFLSESEGQPEGLRVARYRLALALLMTLPGVPQIYYGNELGMTGRAGAADENRADMPAWAFDAATRDGTFPGFVGNPAETFALTRELATLRGETPALRRGGYAELWRPGGSGVEMYVFFRSAGASRVIVAVNAGDTAISGRRTPLRTNPGVSAPDRAAFPDGVALEDALGAWSGGRARVDDGQLVLDLPARSAFVFRL